MNIKKTRTIGIRTDEHFIKLLETPSDLLKIEIAKADLLKQEVGDREDEKSRFNAYDAATNLTLEKTFTLQDIE